jgi:hypothetical protein
MVVVVSIAHVEAVVPLDARGSTEAFIADFVTNAIRVGGARPTAMMVRILFLLGRRSGAQSLGARM